LLPRGHFRPPGSCDAIARAASLRDKPEVAGPQSLESLRRWNHY
jgi:hypothetical protein